jgi:hypothetical protein
MWAEARLPKNGTRRVRMIWTMRVCVSNDSTNQPVWNSFASTSFCAPPIAGSANAAIEKEPHQREGRVVEYGADRTDEHHESLDVVDVPPQGLAHQLVVDIIRRDPRLGDVV